MRKTKPTQAEWYCEHLNKVMYADIHAYAIDGNWLCGCGHYIKDDSGNHRIIRQGSRVPTETERIVVTYDNSKEEKQEYTICYWTGRLPNQVEHTIKIKANGDMAVIKEIEESSVGLLKYIIFNERGKQVKVGN